MSPRRTPAIGSPIDVFQSQVAELINRDHVFTSAPSLESMEVGESAYGNATESSPSAGSHALYFKPNRDEIVVLSFDGVSFSTRYIVSSSKTAPNEGITTLTDTVSLLETLLAEVSLANAHLAVITEAELELGDVV